MKMKPIIKNGTFIAAESISKDMPIESLLRVIWVDQAEDIVVLMRVVRKKLKSPKIFSLNAANDWAEKNKILANKITLPAQHRLDDKQLATRYPPRKKNKISAPLEYRNKWLLILDEITPPAGKSLAKGVQFAKYTFSSRR